MARKQFTERQKVVNALVTKLKEINGTGEWAVNLYNNVYPTMIFMDEVNDFPTVCAYGGIETREYLPGGFKWRFLTVSILVYVQHEEEPLTELEYILSAIEEQIDRNETLTYVEAAAAGTNQTVEMTIQSVSTDQGAFTSEGLAVGEITLEVRY